MQPNSLLFVRRILTSLLVFFLLVSLGVNIFFTLTRNVVSEIETPVPDEGEAEVTVKAFGVVRRGFMKRPQITAASGALLPIGEYRIPDQLLPDLPQELPLYRDQGVSLDQAHVQDLLRALGAPFDPKEIGLLPVEERWRSVDGTLLFALDTRRRLLTVSREAAAPPPTGAAPVTPASDAELKALAQDFAASLGITMPVSLPYVVERKDGDKGTKVSVVWAAKFGDYPLIDVEGRPLAAASVDLNRAQRRAIALTLSLQYPSSLTASLYPRATREKIYASLKTGGFMPVSSTLKNPPTDITYTTASIAYLLLPADSEHPTYVIPVVASAWYSPLSCDRCTPVLLTTYVPALDPESFIWPREEAKKTGTGSDIRIKN